VAHFVPRMEPAAAGLERLGFRLTPFRAQVNAGPDGAPVPAGTGNRCAMLRRGYIEVLAAVAETPLAAQLRQKIARYTGIHLLAFGTADAARERARLAALGFEPLPLVDLRRPGFGGEAEFAVTRVPPDAMPEGRMQFVQHLTEATVWHEDWLEHPNGALALDEVIIAVADPDEAASRFARFCGRSARRRAAGHFLLPCERGSLHLVAPAHLRALLGVEPPVLPFIAAYGLLVRNITAIRAVLEEGGGAVATLSPEALAVTSPAEIGGTLVFKTEHGNPLL
jgi:hypothetical protein